MKKMYQLTLSGKKELEKELKELKSRRAAIAQKIADARDYGDLTENAEWDVARDEQAVAESRIAEIEEILLNAEIIKSTSKSRVAVGSVVVLVDAAGKHVEYTLVGSVEANPLDGKISDQSPIGQALLGKKVNDKVVIKTPKGEATYTVSQVK